MLNTLVKISLSQDKISFLECKLYSKIHMPVKLMNRADKE